MDQEILFNEDAAGSIKEILTKHGVKKPFVLMGKHFQQQNEKQHLLSFQYSSYIKEDAEVTTGEIEKSYAFFCTCDADAIIAIGGGRVIDLSKAIIYEHHKNKLPTLSLFICVPTTAGSGSEATQFAVIYREKVKTSVDKPFLRPGIAVLDPVLTYTLPPLQTAVSGADALAQAIESYWNIHAGMESLKFAADAIGVLLENLPTAVSAPDKLNRKNLLWAAHLAGKAINITRTTGPHALSYFLTAHYNISHGQAVAFFLPLFFIYNNTVDNNNCNHPAGPEKVQQRLHELYAILKVKHAYEAAAYLRSFIKSTGLAITLEEVGINKNNIIDQLLGDINKQRFNNNPVALDIPALKKICMDYL